jgi:hypothetical protein
MPTTVALTPLRADCNPRAMAQGVPEGESAEEKKEGWQIDRSEADEAARPTIRRSVHGCAEIGREREERPRNDLRRAIAREKGVIIDPAARHGGLLQQRQHHMPAAEHERAGAVKAARSPFAQAMA